MKITTVENKNTENSKVSYGESAAAVGLVDKSFALALGCVVIFNGVFNYYLGEILSEGLSLVATLCYLMIRIELKSRFVIQLFALIFFLLISVNQLFATGNQIRLLFIYPYLFFIAVLLMPLYKEKIEVNSDFIAKTIIYFACASSGYAIVQRLGFEIILPLESELRATGLSRSSLNLTGCLFSALAICVLNAKDNYKKIIVELILFLGLVAAGGRGGMICGLVLIGAFYFKNNKILLVILGCLMLLLALIAENHFYKAFSAFDFSDDQSNLDRLDSYSQFFQQFEFLGGGVGSTSPAAMRFTDATGFESSFLNTIYELGVGFSIIFGLAILGWLTGLPKLVRNKIYILSAAIFPMLIGQQLYGIPSAFASLIICLYVILSNRRMLIL